MASWARRNLAADTIFIADVICMVFCTEVMRSRTSCSPPAMAFQSGVTGGHFLRQPLQSRWSRVGVFARLRRCQCVTCLVHKRKSPQTRAPCPRAPPQEVLCRSRRWRFVFPRKWGVRLFQNLHVVALPRTALVASSKSEPNFAKPSARGNRRFAQRARHFLHGLIRLNQSRGSPRCLR